MKNTLLQYRTAIAPSTANLYLMFTGLPASALICLQHVAVANDTTGAKVCHIGLYSGGTYVWLKTITLTTAGSYYTLENPIYFHSSWILAVEVVSPGSGDVVHANVLGYYEE